MPFRQRTLNFAPDDQEIALRLLSAMVLGWDRIPFATQGWIMRDAYVMRNGSTPAGLEAFMAFIDVYKGGDAPPTSV
jgi:hypothetical protein